MADLADDWASSRDTTRFGAKKGAFCRDWTYRDNNRHSRIQRSRSRFPCIPVPRFGGRWVIGTYSGEFFRRKSASLSGGGGSHSVMIHEWAHAIHRFGLNTVDPTFDNRLQIAYDAAIEKGLWQGTYASSDRGEYWAEGTQAWFYPKGGTALQMVIRGKR